MRTLSRVFLRRAKGRQKEQDVFQLCRSLARENDRRGRFVPLYRHGQSGSRNEDRQKIDSPDFTEKWNEFKEQNKNKYHKPINNLTNKINKEESSKITNSISTDKNKMLHQSY